MTADGYDGYKTADVSLDDSGVASIRLHSWNGPLVWGALPHTELAHLLAALRGDERLRAVVITGTGDEFIKLPDGDNTLLSKGGLPAKDWVRVVEEGEHLIDGLLSIPVPVIAAVNGPVTVHSEIAVLADVVLATPDTFFQDAAHAMIGLVPGDGVHVVWPTLLGENRGRYFLLTGQQLEAAEALRLGVVAEVVERSQLPARAQELAADIAARDPIVVRHTRRLLTRRWRRAMAADLSAGLGLEALGSLSLDPPMILAG